MTAALPFLLAVLADALAGDPPSWPHMVRYMGGAISHVEDWLRRRYASPAELRLAGVALVILVVAGSWLVVALALGLAGGLWRVLGVLLAAGLGFQCLAAGQLWREARAVSRPLAAGDLFSARQRLGMIVGRDTAGLDEQGVARALIETMSENLNDGVVAPLFYLALGGAPLAVAYKAVNTLDSMVGYRNERYQDLGRAAARLDDVCGYIPARLTALLLAVACPLLGLSAGQAWAAARRDHGQHKSPNSGWPEAAAAGALGVRLGGPNYYGGVLVDKPWINPTGRQPGGADIATMERLLVLTSALAAGLGLVLVWLARGWV
ncbi:MAG: adenosylcobinamide-phosphate synthase CbiB [Pseudomonadota bacterium]